MKRTIAFLAALEVILLASLALGQSNQGYYYHEVQVVDDNGRAVTDINEVYIYLPGTTTSATVYMDRNLSSAITIPMTIASTNTTLSNGKFYWWGPDQYDFKIGNDTVTAWNEHTQSYNRSIGEIRFPYYLQTVATTAWTDAQNITLGTDLDWVINGGTTANRITFTPASDGATMYLGSTSNQTDIYLWGGASNYVWWDESAKDLIAVAADILLNDDSYLRLGTDSDVGIKYDNSGADLDITCDDLEIAFGVDGGGPDIYWHTETASTNVLFDEDVNEILCTAVDLQLTDAAAAIFGTGDDFSIQSSTAANLDILSAVTDESGIVNIGADTKGVDVKLFAATTADYILFDASDEQLELVGTQIVLDDDSDLFFGSDSDMKLESDTAKTLEIIPGAATDDYAVNLGVDQSGVDLKAFGATTGEYILWDASNDTLSTNCGNVLFTQTDAEANQWKVDATGTVAGYAIVLETTDGGVQINADGAANGDISVDAGDDLTLTAAGDLTLAVTGTVSAGGSAITNLTRTVETFTADDTLLAAESGKVCVSLGAGTPANIVLTLPTAAAGLEFTFVDANATAADDLYVRAASGDTIEDGTANQYYACKTDAVAQTITLVAIDATRWKLIAGVGTWVADDTPD